MLRIVIVNHSSLMSDHEARIMTAACRLQFKRDIAPAWGFGRVEVALRRDLRGVTVRKQKLPHNVAQIAIFDREADAVDLGYHSLWRGAVYGRVYARPVVSRTAGGVVLGDPRRPQRFSIAATLSHEIAELIADPFVNSWVDGFPVRGHGSSYALEVADPVQDTQYLIRVQGVAVAVSDFVYPSWFDPDARRVKFDHVGVLRRPFSLARGGYIQIRGAAGRVRELNGRRVAAWRRATKRSPLSRTFRRK